MPPIQTVLDLTDEPGPRLALMPTGIGDRAGPTLLLTSTDLLAERPPSRPFLPWHDGPLASFDLETTGVDPATARILEVALHLDVPGEPVRRLVDTLVDPGPDVAIPPGAAAVHGITRDRLRREGAPPATEVLPRLHAALCELGRAGTPVVIYNACYDWPLLATELRRLDPPLALSDCHLIDPLLLDRHCDRYRKGKRTLEAACDVYEVVLADAHQAGADCTAAVAVARAIGRRFPEVGGLALDDLRRLQVEAHAVWRNELNAYLQRVGADRPPVRGAWPEPRG
jgi:DNA polymerase III subunit epsilon